MKDMLPKKFINIMSSEELGSLSTLEVANPVTACISQLCGNTFFKPALFNYFRFDSWYLETADVFVKMD